MFDDKIINNCETICAEVAERLVSISDCCPKQKDADALAIAAKMVAAWPKVVDLVRTIEDSNYELPNQILKAAKRVRKAVKPCR